MELFKNVCQFEKTGKANVHLLLKLALIWCILRFYSISLSVFADIGHKVLLLALSFCARKPYTKSIFFLRNYDETIFFKLQSMSFVLSDKNPIYNSFKVLNLIQVILETTSYTD